VFSSRYLLLLLVPTVLLTSSELPPLSDFQGTYELDNQQTLEIIAGKQLFAVISEAKYPLKRTGPDTFIDIANHPIDFIRNSGGSVTGYKDHGQLHPRRSPQVSADSENMASPRHGKEPYRYSPPPALHDGIAVGDIADTPLGRETAHAVETGILDEEWPDVHAVLLYQGGKLVFEDYFYGYTADRLHQLRSATKSVVSALVGIAIDKGDLPGVNVSVAGRLHYSSYANPDPRKTEITLAQFLSMSSGLDCNDHSDASPGRETLIDEQPDWVKATMDLPMMNGTGHSGYYCSGGVAVVGRVVENATHAYLPDFAQESLFGPMGISRTSWKWNYDLTNADKEYSQIHLRPRDMLKLGVLYSDRGRWNGKQVISERWVKASLSRQSTVDDTEYGYFWWHPWLLVKTPAGERRVFVHTAQGNGGQKIYIVPELKLVAVFTGGMYNMGGSSPNKIMASVVLPKLLASAK
jgi:CubicO group peptidase (beta-lactamase class C family)